MNDRVKSMSALQNGARVSAVKMVDSQPGVAAALSKVVAGLHQPLHDERGRRRIQSPDYFHMSSIAGDLAHSIQDNENLLQMLPDLELASQILISSILSPKDMMDARINYVAPEGLFTAATNAALVNTIQVHFTQVYNINRRLPKILKDILFKSGSYPIAVVPESSIDYLINRDIIPDMQSYRALTDDVFDGGGKIKHIGILGPATKRDDSGLRAGLGLEEHFQTDNRTPYDAAAKFALEEYDNSSIKVPDDQLHVPLKFAAESMDPHVSFTDNPYVLKVPALAKKMAEYEASQKLKLRGHRRTKIGTEGYKVALEAFVKQDKSNLNDQQIYSLISRSPGGRSRQVNALTPQGRLGRRTIGAPLVLELPPESVIPVYAPGQPETHVGYYVIIDETGNPITKNTNPRIQDQLSQQFSMPGNAQHRLIQQAHAAFVGMQCTSTNYIDYATRIYGDMIEAEMVSRLKNGLYKTGVTIARNDDIYRLMMARTFRAQHTQLLFIPAEMMTYYALDFNDNGTGRSIMDDLKTINALRAILTISSVMGSVRNSIGRTKVDIKLDEDDPDPYKSREKAMQAFANTRSSLLPIHLNRPLDIVSTLQQAGVEFNTTGNAKIPDMTVDINEVNSNVQKPDQELDDNLRRMSFMRFGLSPETVDNGFTGEFATSVVANNILLSRRVRQTQEQFVPLVTQNVRMITRATEALYDELRETIATNYETIQVDDETKAMLTVEGDEETTKSKIIDYALETFIDELQCELPSPDTTTVENQLAAFQSWKDLFDELLDAHITADMFNSELDGATLTDKMDQLKAVVRSYHIRKWCVDNNVMPELTSLTAKDADGKPMVDILGEHANYAEEISALFAGVLTSTANLGKRLDAVAEGLLKPGEQPEDGGGSSYGGDTSSSSSGDDGFGGGGMDFGGGGGDDLDSLLGGGDDLSDPAGP